MNRELRGVLLGACLLTCLQPASAGIMVGDGSLTDWGLTVVNNGSFPELPPNPTLTSTIHNPGAKTDKQIVGQHTAPGGLVYSYALEDQDDTYADYLGPNGGGQPYDAEFLGVGSAGGLLYISVVTGQRPDNQPDDNGNQSFSPGDVRIVTSGGVYGVEVGGGWGGSNVHSGAIASNALGSTYYVDQYGTPKGVVNSDGSTAGNTNGLSISANQTAGSVWFNPNWILDPFDDGNGDANFVFDGYQPVQMVVDAQHGTLVGTSNFAFTWKNDNTNLHSIIEMAIPLSFFGANTIDTVQWSMGCGNDVLRVAPQLQQDTATPEPASLAMALLGSFGLFLRSRKSPRQTAATAS